MLALAIGILPMIVFAQAKQEKSFTAIVTDNQGVDAICR
jgi:hypothetical protein